MLFLLSSSRESRKQDPLSPWRPSPSSKLTRELKYSWPQPHITRSQRILIPRNVLLSSWILRSPVCEVFSLKEHCHTATTASPLHTSIRSKAQSLSDGWLVRNKKISVTDTNRILFLATLAYQVQRLVILKKSQHGVRDRYQNILRHP